MTKTPHEAPYTLRHIEQMLGLSRGVVAGLVSAGYVAPSRGPRNEFRFSFQDVVLLRTAFHLQAAQIGPRRLMRSLKQLRAKLPAEVPLSGLRIQAIGNDVAVRDGGAHWSAETGQLLMDFEVAPSRSSQGSVTFLMRDGGAAVAAKTPSTASSTSTSAADWFARGAAAEPTDAAAAEAAYRAALQLAPDHVDAYLNLGALLCEAGRCGEAVDLYGHATAVVPDAPLLHFNAAIALEDQQRDREALDSYLRCLGLDPELADAHYNAARLCEKLGDARGSLRHYSAYRRLQRLAGADEP